jgi:predicted AlkP superfamily phosphohydrolase/phosphomutase
MRQSTSILCKALAFVFVGGLMFGCGGSDDASKSKEKAGNTASPAKAKKPAGRTGPAKNRVVIIGFDGVDPDWVEKWRDELPNISKLVGEGNKVGRLGTTTPPQSPVAWSSFATSLNPGGHGIFDFVARDPKTYFPAVGTNSYAKARFDAAGKLIQKATATSPRAGTPFWKVAAQAGQRARVLFVPYSFPPEELPDGQILSGLGTPDLRLTNSTFYLFSTSATETEAKKDVAGGDIVQLVGAGPYTGTVKGPKGLTKKRETVDVTVTRKGDDKLEIQIGEAKVSAQAGQFTDWVDVEFPISNWYIAKAMVRFYPFEVGDDIQIYMYPLLVHPEAPYIDLSTPVEFAQSLRASYGSYKTIGWEHDTSALNSNLVPDEVFVADRGQIFEQRLKMTLGELEKNDSELFIGVFTDTDRASHMFLRLSDKEFVSYDAGLAKKYGGFIKQTYLDMDRAIGLIQQKLNPGDTLLIMSDHGFHSFKRGFNTNSWLLKNGYLSLAEGKERKKSNSLMRGDVDWAKTKAYAYGTGQIYINRKGRERDGPVPANESEALAREIAAKLKGVKDGRKKVFSNVYVGTDIYKGAMVAGRAPDLQLAFHEGFQTSRATSLGGIPMGLFSDNKKKWSGDHAASDAADTEGFLLSSMGALGPDAHIIDLAPTALGLLGVDVPSTYEGKKLTATK